MSKEIDYVGEGSTDDAMARKMIESVACIPGKARRNPVKGNGKASLDKRINGLNAGVVHGGNPILALRDLDNDEICPGALVARLVRDRHPYLFLRICVRSAESWLFADAKSYAAYCGINEAKLPAQPDLVERPKRLILSWRSSSARLRRHFEASEKRGLSELAIVAVWNKGFIEDHWDPLRATSAGNSSSLCRAMRRLQAFADST